MVNATRPKSLLSQRKTLTNAGLAADNVGEGHAHVFVQDLCVAARLAGLVVGLTHRWHIANDVHAGGSSWHDDHRVGLVRSVLRVAGLAHHDQEIADRCVRREPLVAVDHPFVAIAHRAGGEQRGVCASAGFGHAETAPHRAGQQRLHPLLALLGSATH